MTLCFFTDNENMSIGEYVKLCLNVLKDFRVIITAVLMILIIEFAKYITSYKKKPPREKVKKAAPQPVAPAPAETANAETQNAEESSEAAE